jgi:hypothetical protein
MLLPIPPLIRLETQNTFATRHCTSLHSRACNTSPFQGLIFPIFSTCRLFNSKLEHRNDLRVLNSVGCCELPAVPSDKASWPRGVGVVRSILRLSILKLAFSLRFAYVTTLGLTPQHLRLRGYFHIPLEHYGCIAMHS